MTTFHYSAGAILLALALGACGGGGGDAPVPSPTAEPSQALIAEGPQGGRLAAAVAAVYPRGTQAQGEHGERYVFSSHRLIDTPFGPVLASEGRVQDAAHVDSGRIDLAYLTRSGAGFTVARRYPAAIVTGSFGQMSDWAVRRDLAAVPTIVAEGGMTAQGYSCAMLVMTELRPDGPVETAEVQNLYDDTGAKADADGTSFEGTIATATPDGFEMRFTGTRAFTERYARQGGRWTRLGATQLPEC